MKILSSGQTLVSAVCGTIVTLLAACIWLAQSDSINAQESQDKDKSIPETAKTTKAAHIIDTKRYLITGENDGRVKFADFNRKHFTAFHMDAGKWAREVFVLDDGKIVGASQADHAVFWNVKTGKEIGRVPERVYGFSHDQKHCIAQNNRGSLSVYEYPSLKRIGQLKPPLRGGISAILFSPNDRYLAIECESAFPEPEETYPFVKALKNAVATQLYNLKTMQEVPNFTALRLAMGTFSADSAAYMGFGTIYKDRKPMDGIWRFDLQTFEVSAIETPKM